AAGATRPPRHPEGGPRGLVDRDPLPALPGASEHDRHPDRPRYPADRQGRGQLLRDRHRGWTAGGEESGDPRRQRRRHPVGAGRACDQDELMEKTERLLDLVALLLDAREPVSFAELRDLFPDEYGGPRERP